MVEITYASNRRKVRCDLINIRKSTKNVQCPTLCFFAEHLSKKCGCYCRVEACEKRGYKDKDGKIQGANSSTCPIVEGSMGRQNTITAASRVPSNFLSLSFSLPSSGFYPASRFLSRSHRKPFFGTKNASNSRPLLLLLAACST